MSWANKERGGKSFVMPTLEQARIITVLNESEVAKITPSGVLEISFTSSETDQLYSLQAFCEANGIDCSIANVGESRYVQTKRTSATLPLAGTLVIHTVDDMALLASAGLKFPMSDVLKESFRTQAALGQSADKGII